MTIGPKSEQTQDEFIKEVEYTKHEEETFADIYSTLSEELHQPFETIYFGDN